MEFVYLWFHPPLLEEGDDDGKDGKENDDHDDDEDDDDEQDDDGNHPEVKSEGGFLVLLPTEVPVIVGSQLLVVELTSNFHPEKKIIMIMIVTWSTQTLFQVETILVTWSALVLALVLVLSLALALVSLQGSLGQPSSSMTKVDFISLSAETADNHDHQRSLIIKVTTPSPKSFVPESAIEELCSHIAILV